jgi:hypothetical protein
MHLFPAIQECIHSFGLWFTVGMFGLHAALFFIGCSLFVLAIVAYGAGYRKNPRTWAFPALLALVLTGKLVVDDVYCQLNPWRSLPKAVYTFHPPKSSSNDEDELVWVSDNPGFQNYFSSPESEVNMWCSYHHSQVIPVQLQPRAVFASTAASIQPTSITLPRKETN